MKVQRMSWVVLLAGFSVFVVQEASAYYAPHLGRFLTRDPGDDFMPNVSGRVQSSGFVGPANTPGRYVARGYVDGPNLYQYVHSNPVLHTDPSGLRVVKCCKYGTDPPCHFVWVPDSYKGDPCRHPYGESNQTDDQSTAVLYCLGDKECEQDLVKLFNQIDQTWNNGAIIGDTFVGIGATDTCTRWASNYMEGKRDNIGMCKKLNVCKKDFPYRGWWPGWDHHSAVRIRFPSGCCIYLDQGWLGGADHIFFPPELPPTYQQ